MPAPKLLIWICNIKNKSEHIVCHEIVRNCLGMFTVIERNHKPVIVQNDRVQKAINNFLLLILERRVFVCYTDDKNTQAEKENETKNCNL